MTVTSESPNDMQPHAMSRLSSVSAAITNERPFFSFFFRGGPSRKRSSRPACQVQPGARGQLERPGTAHHRRHRPHQVRHDRRQGSFPNRPPPRQVLSRVQFRCCDICWSACSAQVCLCSVIDRNVFEMTENIKSFRSECLKI